MAVIINGTTGIVDVDGTAAAPAITGLDTDTGLYFTTNALGLSTAGTAALYINSSGNVGIGTTSPTTKLTLKPDGQTDYTLHFGTWGYGTSYGTKIYVQSENEAGTVSSFSNITKLYSSVNTRANVQQWLSYISSTASNDYQYWSTGGVERMRIDGSGNVGIGTTPTQTFEISSSNQLTDTKGNLFIKTSNAQAINIGAQISLGGFYDGSSTYGFGSIAGRKENSTSGNVAGYLQLSTTTSGGALTERMRIDSSGNVGIGTTNLTTGSSSGAVFVAANSSVNITGQTSSAQLGLGNYNNGVNATNGTLCGSLAFRTYFNSTFSGGSDIASITGVYTGNGTTRTGGIAFYTINAGAESEKMRIDSNGNVLIGNTSAFSSSTKLYVYNAVNGTITAPQAVISGGTSTYEIVMFLDGTAAYIGQNSAIRELRMFSGTTPTTGVKLTNGATSWSASSDENLKDIIEPIENAIEKISTLRTVIGKYKDDEANTRRPFLIAQDVEKVLPEAIHVGSDDTLNLSYTETIPLLVAAIKEQQAQIEELKAAIAELKA
jgi:hypothetical protein